MNAGQRLQWLMLLFALGMMSSANAEPNGGRATLAIIIDDIGYAYKAGVRALDLPGQITYAMLPHAPHTNSLAELAHRRHKEIILHLPMQSGETKDLGPGGLTLHMTEIQFKQSVKKSLDAVPYAQGINNHMGSLLTRHPGHMRWLMEVIQAHGDLYFVDTRTTSKTITHLIAHEHKVPHISRDVFLDAIPHDKRYVEKELKRAINLAKREGYALAIAHPYEETLDVLQKELHRLKRRGVRLVNVGTLITQAAVPSGGSISHDPAHLDSSAAHLPSVSPTD